MTTKIIYAIPAPYAPAMIEVYGDPDFVWYEWRLVGQDGELLQDTESQAYGSAEIALRDALNWCHQYEIDSTDFDGNSF